MTGVLMRNLDTDTQIGRMSCEDEGRDWGGTSANQGTLKIAIKPPEVRGEAWNRVFLRALRRNQLC